MSTKRILDEATTSIAASDDYLYIDGATNGSRKITPENIVSNSTVAQNLAEHISEANETITEMQADYSELVDEVSALKEDLNQLTLGIDENDGLLYIFLNGVKQGEGIEMSTATKIKIVYDLMSTNTNGAARANEGEGYTATLTASSGLIIDSVIVTMGDVDITSSAWDANTRKISISSVNAPVTITATAVTTPDTITLEDVDSTFQDRVTEVVEAVNNKNENNISFVVLTDTHGSANGQKSQNVVRYLLKNSRANKLFWLGDISSTNWSTSEYETFRAPLLNCYEKVYPTLGNHEFFGNSAISSLSEIYTDFLDDKTLQGAPSSYYYYFDDANRKIRYLVINTSEGATDKVSSTQLEWIATAVQLPSAQWGVIVLSHYPFNRALGSSSGGVQNYTNSYLDIMDALETTNGTIISHICGHRHADVTAVLDYEFYEQVLLNDSASGQAVNVINIDLDTKDVTIYRIGSGQDITYNYEDIPAKVTRTITANLTGCTSNNSTTSIVNGRPYTATLTPNTNYSLASGNVTVTMGGTDVTSTVYSNQVITIPEVTGDIVITAVADYVAPIDEYTADWLIKDTSVKYPKFTLSSTAAAVNGFPDYLSIIMCNGTTGFPTGFRSSSFAKYSTRTTGYTANNHDWKSDLTTSAAWPTATVDEKKYSYVCFSKSESDAAYTNYTTAIDGGQLDNVGAAGIELSKSKASSLASDYDYWVIDQEVNSTNIESIARRLPAHE